MKTLFTFIVVLLLGLVTGGLYYKMRKPESRTADWKRVLGIPAALKGYVKALFGTKAPAAAPTTEAKPVAA